MLSKFTTEQLEDRLSWVESLINKERDPKNLPYHNHTYQRIMDELVLRDTQNETSLEKLACDTK